MKQLLPILCVLIIGSCSSKEAALNFICESETLSGEYTLRINMQNKTMYFNSEARQGIGGNTFSKDFTNGESLITALSGNANSSVESFSFNKFSGLAYENFTWGSIKFQCRKIESLM